MLYSSLPPKHLNVLYPPIKLLTHISHYVGIPRDKFTVKILHRLITLLPPWMRH